MTRRPLHLLLVTGRADVGGGPRHVDLLVRNLPSDFRIWIACPDEPPYAATWREHPRVNGVAWLPARRFSFVALIGVARLVRRERIDVVYSHGPSGGLYARLLRLVVPRLRVVHAFHGIHVAQYRTFTRLAYVAVERMLRWLTARFVHVSTGERDAAVAVGLSGPTRAVVIYNGIETMDVPDPSAFPELANPARPVIAMLTRFVYAKNLDLALEIARLAKSAHPEWRFVWAGDGPDRTRIERAAREATLDNITFLGAIPRSADLLGRASVLLSTSRWEGLPYALLESGLLGVPVVATRVVGNSEVVADGVSGYLFPVDSPSAGVEALSHVLSDPSGSLRLAANARAVIADRFSLDRSVSRTAQLLREVGGAA